MGFSSEKDSIEFAWQAATLAERERCALICEEYEFADNAAEAIRGE